MRIIVTTSPARAGLLPVFHAGLARAWPRCRWPVETVGAVPPDDGWASNILAHLGESTDPFLLLMDDYILDAVDETLLEIAAMYVQVVDTVGMVRVHPCPGPTLPLNSDLGVIDKRAPYALSLQGAIWRPQVCRDLFRPGENAWQTEIDGSRRAESYDHYTFLGTHRSAIGYRNLLRRGDVTDSQAQAWIAENLPRNE